MTLDNQWNLCCPGCGQDDGIDIAATVWVRGSVAAQATFPSSGFPSTSAAMT